MINKRVEGVGQFTSTHIKGHKMNKSEMQQLFWKQIQEWEETNKIGSDDAAEMREVITAALMMQAKAKKLGIRTIEQLEQLYKYD